MLFIIAKCIIIFNMLTLSHIYKTYKNKSRLVNALNDINLTFPNNGLVFILGESGAGKSTLLNLIRQSQYKKFLFWYCLSRL